MLDTSARLLRLLSVLSTRLEWTGTELAERLDVHVRTVRRDMARLRELGYSVEAAPGVAGGYRLAAGSALPPLLLDDDEAIAVVLSLRTATSHTATGIAETSLSALAKLERILPARLRHRAAALRLATVPLTASVPTVSADVLTLIAEACQGQRRLTFGYRGRDGEASARTVEPYRLVHTGRRWYLVARDLDRDGWRTFRVDRIDAPRSTGVRFTPRDLPDAAALVADSVTTAPYRFQARVLVHAPADAIAERVPPTTGVIEAVDKDSCQLTTGANSLTLIAAHLALLGYDFTVLEPAELIQELKTVSDRLAGAHRASTRHRPR
ncbi:MAG TPA: YafY family protein [Micromonosporaceae bacterium]|nr:YafY family protein [Micromonosporaceae bacterium]